MKKLLLFLLFCSTSFAQTTTNCTTDYTGALTGHRGGVTCVTDTPQTDAIQKMLDYDPNRLKVEQAQREENLRRSRLETDALAQQILKSRSTDPTTEQKITFLMRQTRQLEAVFPEEAAQARVKTWRNT